MSSDEDAMISAARRAIGRWHEGRLASARIGADTQFVIDDSTGALILFSEPGALESEAPAMLIPDESDPEIELLLDLRGQPGEAQRDQWRAYHGADRRGAWALGTVESVRLRISPGPTVLDGPDVVRPNPLRAHVRELLRHANRDPGRLAGAVRRKLGAASAEPVAVGVDPWGLDVRARFGPVRFEFDREAGDVDSARTCIDGSLEDSA